MPLQMQCTQRAGKIDLRQQAVSGCTRLDLINRDPAGTGEPAEVELEIGFDRMYLFIHVDQPITIYSDNRLHVTTTDPQVQLTEWNRLSDRYELTIRGCADHYRVEGATARVWINGRRIPGISSICHS